jgi:hypothetical protein
VIGSAIMLAIGIASVPNAGAEDAQRLHCARHETGAAHGQAAVQHVTPNDASPTSNGRTSHDCPHCPASECARVASCTSTTTNALSPLGLAIVDLQGLRIPLGLVDDQVSSAHSPPDTPPPQLIA